MDSLTFQKAAGVGASTAARWADPVSAAMALYAIDTPARMAAFIAQIGHESISFAYTREIWGPTAAQNVYEPPSTVATRLGNTQPGDGKRFMGRGLIQITGRYNYQQVSNALGTDFITTPELLEEPDNAVLSAAWFWNTHGLNAFADSGDFVTLTKRINGGTNGLADRQIRWGVAKAALGV